MNSFDRHIYLTSINWKNGDTELSDDEIQDACNARYVAKQKAKKAVLAKLGITATELALLLD